MTSPAIIIVTGAWHVPNHYIKLSHRLMHLGFTVECCRLETNNNVVPPDRTLDDDICQIRNQTLRTLATGRDVVALMHSYGGVVGSTAFADLDADNRNGQACVRALIYMSAFITFEDESLAGIFGGKLPPFLKPNDRGTIDIEDVAYMFYHDLNVKDQAIAASHLVEHPIRAQFEPPKVVATRAAWRQIPVTYIFCQSDHALPIQIQEMMVSRAEKAENNLKVTREYCAAGHSPFLSMPEQMVEVVSRVCQRVRGIPVPNEDH